ncbi:MAG TPA: hypothetical protein VNX68_02295 [Nitrosopumilaceae archaeon]|jgi:hypothetical protein|nr:hypothetical protein [Nitrosopumilaceae archaeon]
MPARKIKCSCCGKKFWASRIDTLYCSQNCRARIRQENANFEFPKIPQSHVEGISWRKTIRQWEIKIKLEDNSWKYIGCRKQLQDAIDFQRFILKG